MILRALGEEAAAMAARGADQGQNLEWTEEEEPRIEAGKSWLAKESCEVS